MAKKTKTASAGQSVLRAAYEAFERGDAVTARRLALEVLAGRVGKDDAEVGKELAATLSSPEAPVDESPQAVAQDLIARTKVPGKPYVFALVVGAVYALLVALAAART